MNRRGFIKTALGGAAIALTARGGLKKAYAAAKSRTDTIDFYCHFSAMRVIDYLEAAGGPKPHVFRSLFANTPTLIDPDRRL
ncbi:MAG: hypothetical protein EHM15_08350, partial [Desulfobacteraceae bacterium]